LALVWQTSPRLIVAATILRLTRAAIPFGTLWIGKLVIDEVMVARETSSPDWHRLGLLLGGELCLILLSDLTSRGSQLVEGLMSDRFTDSVTIRIMEHASALDLASYERPELYDYLERARGNASGRIALLIQLLGTAQSVLTLFSLMAGLVVFSPWLFALLAIATIPAFVVETYFAGHQYSLHFRQTPERRHLDYVRELATSNATAKEVQIFGLGQWLVTRYRTLAAYFYDSHKQLILRQTFSASLVSAFGSVAAYSAYVLIVRDAASGRITLGTLTFLGGSFMRSRDLLQNVLFTVAGIAEQALYLRDLFAFFDLQPTVRSKAHAATVPQVFKRGFEFENLALDIRAARAGLYAILHCGFPPAKK